MPRWEEKRVNEQSTRGSMDLLVLGHILLSSQDTLLSSSVMYYSVQAGPVLVLHVASIMGTVVQLLTRLHTRSTQAHTHRRNLTHVASHTNAAFRVKVKAKK